MSKFRSSKPKKKIPNTGETHIIDILNKEWSEFLIENAYYPRIKAGKVACDFCHKKDSFHNLGCILEFCPKCGISVYAWDCKCESYTEPDIVCEE